MSILYIFQPYETISESIEMLSDIANNSSIKANKGHQDLLDKLTPNEQTENLEFRVKNIEDNVKSTT